MANAELNVILHAEGSQLSSTLKKAGKDVQGFGNELKTLPPHLNKLDTSVGKTSRAITNAGTAVRKSKTDFTNWSRVIQDLPFGLIGIQNNLTQLIPGVGLLGLAFSGLITALTFSQVGLSNWSRGSKDASDEAKKSGREFETLAERQKRLSEEFDNAAKSIIGQTTRVEDLGRALIDTSNKTDILSAATIKQGLAQVLFTQKEGLAQQLIASTLEAQLKSEKNMFELRKNAFKVIEKTSKLTPLRLPNAAELKQSGFALGKTEQQLFDLNALAKDLGLNFEQFVDAPKASGVDKTFDDLLKRVRAWEKFINDRTIRVANFTIDPDEPKASVIARANKFIEDAINRRSTAFDLKNVELFISPISAQIKKTAAFFESLKGEAARLIENIQSEISKLTKRNPLLVEFDRVQAEQKSRGNEFFQGLGLGSIDENGPKTLLTDMQKAAINTANVVKNTLTPAFADLFNAIASGENPIKAFFKGIATAVTQLIQQLIQAVIQAILIKAVLSAFGLGKSVGGIGDIVKGLLGFKAEGGPVFANRPYVVGERGPELFIPQGGGRIIPNNEMNSGLAGIMPGMIPVTVTGRLRGKDILLSGARESGSQNRNF